MQWVPGSKADLLQEEEQVREPAGRRDIVQHVADAVGQDRPPSERVRLRRHRSILCISHGECWLGSTATTAFDQLQL